MAWRRGALPGKKEQKQKQKMGNGEQEVKSAQS
jgi:hypothetical protein